MQLQTGPPPDELARQAQVFDSVGLLRDFLDAAPYPALVLNDDRRIVFTNRALRDLAGAPSPLGLRVGDALRCIHADNALGGCGASESCGECGANSAILGAYSGLREARECRITRHNGGVEESLDLLVNTAPVTVAGERYIICTLADISHEKRRRALERIFFHDILNAAGGIRGLADALREIVQHGEGVRCVELLNATSRQLIADIQSQQQLLAAERGELSVSLAAVDTMALLNQLAAQYAVHEVGRGRAISVDPASAQIKLATDVSLLGRVLGNLIKNALEATPPGQSITVGCDDAGAEVVFRVHNPAAMPREVQLQIFQRSFSTKGIGRGLGTYSVKLLTERYLGGRVEFHSEPGTGTTFLARIPRLLTV